MQLWMLILLLGIVKLPLVGMMLWMPFRSDPPNVETPDASQDDGGSKTLPGPHDGRRHPRGPLPRLPRRGPHGGITAPAPARVRITHAYARGASGKPHER